MTLFDVLAVICIVIGALCTFVSVTVIIGALIIDALTGRRLRRMQADVRARAMRERQRPLHVMRPDGHVERVWPAAGGYRARGDR